MNNTCENCIWWNHQRTHPMGVCSGRPAGQFEGTIRPVTVDRVGFELYLEHEDDVATTADSTCDGFDLNEMEELE